MLARSQLCLLGQNYACLVTAMLSLSELCSLFTPSQSQLHSLGHSYACSVTAMITRSELCSHGYSYARSVRAMLVWSELPSLSQSYTWSVKAMLTLSQLRSLGQSYARLVRATLAQSEIHLVRAMLTYYDTFSNSRDNPNYIKYYMNITRTFLLGIIPFVALLYFNIKIYQRFRQTRNRYTRQKNNNRCRQAKDLQLALILVLVVCMFFCDQSPKTLTQPI